MIKWSPIKIRFFGIVNHWPFVDETTKKQEGMVQELTQIMETTVAAL